ncbi:MAG: hypothetical protein ACLTDV_14190 [Eubacterium sp.]
MVITYSNSLVYRGSTLTSVGGGIRECFSKQSTRTAMQVTRVATFDSYTTGRSWADGKTTLGTAEGDLAFARDITGDEMQVMPAVNLREARPPHRRLMSAGGELARTKQKSANRADRHGNGLDRSAASPGYRSVNETVKKADEDAKPADGLGMDKDGNWFYYKDGESGYCYTGLATEMNYGWWYVEAGQIQRFNVTGLVNDRCLMAGVGVENSQD